MLHNRDLREEFEKEYDEDSIIRIGINDEIIKSKKYGSYNYVYWLENQIIKLELKK